MIIVPVAACSFCTGLSLSPLHLPTYASWSLGMSLWEVNAPKTRPNVLYISVEGTEYQYHTLKISAIGTYFQCWLALISIHFRHLFSLTLKGNSIMYSFDHIVVPKQVMLGILVITTLVTQTSSTTSLVLTSLLQYMCALSLTHCYSWLNHIMSLLSSVQKSSSV